MDAKFILVHGKNNNNPVVININEIMYIDRDIAKQRTIIYLSKNNMVSVNETPEKIYQLIQNQKSK
jgi:hypothetical protein